MLVPCPQCKKQVVWEGNPFRPFCSERCRLIDLGQWASEGYKIPVKDEDAEPGEKNEIPDEEDDSTLH
jgi:endogenous inhibitor of DNA gyrase (YacG/DUF329 family)